MLGAIIGDIVGSVYERHNIKSKSFEFFSTRHPCRPTDDSIMTLAVANAILNAESYRLPLEKEAVKQMQMLGAMYPHAGYGGKFRYWLRDPNPLPYNSYGNGAAMRVSPCGFAAVSLADAISKADAVTKVTHNHPEGMKGAEATAAAIYLARTGKTIPEIRDYINQNFYRIDFTLDEIRPFYSFDVSCQGSVPQALEAFFESTSFEDAIRNAISIGGDSDTIAAITGGIAEAYYGIPPAIRKKALTYLDEAQLSILTAFESKYGIPDEKTRQMKMDDFSLSLDSELAALFKKVCAENGYPPQTVLDGFMKDYIVSGGHPEHVTGGMPWNKKQ